MNSAPKFFIQQIAFNGSTYTYGKAVDIESKFNIVCSECPFVLFPESKELPSRNYVDEDGIDEYIPQELPLKEYSIDVTFLYNKTRDNTTVTDETIRADIKAFIRFLYGRTASDSTDTIRNARLAMYCEETGIGRKDVRIKKVDNKLYYHETYDAKVVLKFVITFQVNDPVTDVAPKYNQQGEFIGLRWGSDL